MKILAIETATACVACALWSDEGPVASFTLSAGQRHAEMLVPAIDELRMRAGWSVADLGGVVVDVGPGLFTGLRVGIATANTIATARGIPALGVTSLEVLAHPHRRRRGLLAPLVDARRGEIYWALYESGEPDERGGSHSARLRQLRPPAVASPEDVAAELGSLNGAVLAVGDGAWRYRDVFEAAGTEVAGEADKWPSPLAVAELGFGRMARSHDITMRLPEPLYLRQADVRIGWEEVGGRVVGRTTTPAGAALSSGAPKLAQ
jgi:tRNA threonylcarbamoyladenosine biosynthesis protein TsaB